MRDEAGFTQALKSLVPVDHIVFSAVDNIIRGELADLDLDAAKHLFGVKFWGAVTVGKGTIMPDDTSRELLIQSHSCLKARDHPQRWIAYTHIRDGRY